MNGMTGGKNTSHANDERRGTGMNATMGTPAADEAPAEDATPAGGAAQAREEPRGPGHWSAVRAERARRRPPWGRSGSSA